MKKLLACALLSWPISAFPTTFSSDWTDLWWNSTESGWGVNIIQQSDRLFLTFFVYALDGSAVWYSASDVRPVGTSFTAFQGELHETRGARFAGATSTRLVGNVSISFPTLYTATMTYSVDGSAVTKQMSRYTFRNNNMGGSYVGLLLGTYSSCSGVGYAEEASPLLVTQFESGSTTWTTSGQTTCNFQGTYSQHGRLSKVDGSVTCTANGVSIPGTFNFFDMDPTISGFAGRGTMTFSNGCSWSGRVGGMRRNLTASTLVFQKSGGEDAGWLAPLVMPPD